MSECNRKTCKLSGDSIPELGDGEPSPPPDDKDCICFGNWRLLVKEVEPLFGKTYRDSEGRDFVFIGLIHGEDDYYYGMYSKEHGLRRLSCVGSLESWDYKERESGAAQEVSPPSPDTKHIWDSITRVAESRHDYGVCTLTRSACQKLIGERLHGGDTRELKAALEDCIKIASRFVNSCDTQNIAATIYAHIKGRARSVGVF